MTTIATHTTWMTQRQVKALVRQPAYLIIQIIQPAIWLFLFGSLFRKVAELPGFGAPSYLDYLVPGVVVMSALSTSMWSGMTVLEEIDRGIMDRFLVLPLRRSAIINASVVMQSISTAIQSLIIVGLGLAAGARYPGGAVGLIVLLVVSVLVAVVFSALSNTIGMLARQRETIIGLSVFLLLPLTFLSTAFMAPALMPHWMRIVADCNPVNWALEAARAAMSATPDWARVARPGRRAAGSRGRGHRLVGADLPRLPEVRLTRWPPGLPDPGPGGLPRTTGPTSPTDPASPQFAPAT